MKYCPECSSKLCTKIIDGESRYVCIEKECTFVHWNNPIPIVVALVCYDDCYIVARNSKWPTGLFSLIAGYLEKGESAEQGILREVSEELGLQGSIHKFLGHYPFPEKNQLIIAYEVYAEGELEVNHELAEIKYLSATELTQYDFSPLRITEEIVRAWSKLN